VYVSLNYRGQLRGMSGSIAPAYKNVAEEIFANAAAATRDERFSPVNEDELLEMEYTVDVLSDIEPVTSPAQLDAAKYGVVVNAYGKTGVMLPDITGIDTPDEQIAAARDRAGISPDDSVKITRFTTERHFAAI